MVFDGICDRIADPTLNPIPVTEKGFPYIQIKCSAALVHKKTHLQDLEMIYLQ